MKNSLNLKLVAVAALMASSVAHATQTQVPTQWFEHDSAEFASFSSAVKHTFEHEYLFHLNGTVDALATAVSNDALTKFNIDGGKVELFLSNGDSNYANDVSMGSFEFDSTAVNSSFSSLLAGDYYYQVTGAVMGNKGGGYQLFSEVTPVPEPETYAMLLAGLGLVGFMVRRRKTGN